MSANVETMFYAGREVPWHGLGTQVESALTSIDALEAAGLNWTVESQPIFTNEGLAIPGYCANVRNTDKSVLGIVTPKYQIVQNSEAFDFTDALLGEGCRYETAGSLHQGKQVWLLAKMPQTKILGEEFDPYLCFTNCHDGTGSIRVAMTPVRVVCQNTLNFALSSAKRSWSTRHRGDLKGKLQEAKNTLEMSKLYMAVLAEEAEKLANQKVTEGEIEKILDNVFPVNEDDTARKKAAAQNLKTQFYICYNMPDIAQFFGTKYGVMNAITDFADHVAPARMTRNYAENNWGRIMNGHSIVDNVYKQLVAA